VLAQYLRPRGFLNVTTWPQWFGAQHRNIAFTHIYPGQVATTGKEFNPGWLLTPLAWLVGYMRTIVPQVCLSFFFFFLT
jgi:hypothetical protein